MIEYEPPFLNPEEVLPEELQIFDSADASILDLPHFLDVYTLRCDGKSNVCIAEVLDVSIDKVNHIASKLIKSGMIARKWRPVPNIDDEVERMRRMGMNRNDIARELGVKRYLVEFAVKRLMKEGKIPDRKRTTYINEEFFCEHSPDLAYFMGLFAADGTMGNGKHYNYTVAISQKDAPDERELFEKLQERIGGSIYNVRSEKFPQIQLSVSRKFVNDHMRSLGFTSNKTFTMQLPELPDEYLSHFVRGFFDGDGCAYITTREKINRPYITFTNASTDFLLSLSEKLRERLQVTSTTSQVTETTKRLIYAKMADVPKIYNFMYKDSSDLYLERKKKKFESVYGQ